MREEKNADRSDAAMLLALLQMREAVIAARPFPGEYAAFQALARDRADLTAAAAPLAAAAREGIAGREVLKERLAALGDRIAEAAEPESDGSWWDEALARLRGLVSIRHIGAPPSGPEAVVAGAQTMLAGGDLKGAVAAVGTLEGAEAKLAEPWLRMARGRLEAEQALARLQEMLVARLGGLAGTRAGGEPERERGPGPDPGEDRNPLMRVLAGLIGIAALIGVGVFFADHPGQVEIVWRGWQARTSVGVLVAAAVLAALAAGFALRLILLVVGSPGIFLRRRRERRRHAGYRALTQGMVAVAAGDAVEARRSAKRAEALLAEPPLTLLLSAQAAQLEGDEAAAKKFFTLMLDRPETEFLGLRGLLNQAVGEGDRGTALGLPSAPFCCARICAGRA